MNSHDRNRDLRCFIISGVFFAMSMIGLSLLLGLGYIPVYASIRPHDCTIMGVSQRGYRYMSGGTVFYNVEDKSPYYVIYGSHWYIIEVNYIIDGDNSTQYTFEDGYALSAMADYAYSQVESEDTFQCLEINGEVTLSNTTLILYMFGIVVLSTMSSVGLLWFITSWCQFRTVYENRKKIIISNVTRHYTSL